MDSERCVLLLNLLQLSFIVTTSRGDTASIRQNPNIVTNNEEPEHGFKKLVTNNKVFVDKSLLIKDFLENPAKVILVTCPRNWGKSTNLDMMQRFFQPEGGSKIPSKDRWNYRLFALGKLDRPPLDPSEWDLDILTAWVNIGPLSIAKHPVIIDQYLGQYPVIYFDLGQVTISGYKSIFQSLRWPLLAAFYAHDYVELEWGRSWGDQSEEDLKTNPKFAFSQHFNKFAGDGRGDYTEKEAIESLKFLSKHLFKYSGKKVFIFFDNYDEPIRRLFLTNAGQNTDAKQKAERWVDLLQRFFKATFLENEYLEKGFITGETDFEIPRLFSVIPNLKPFNVVKNEFYKHFGLTEGEVDLLFKESGIRGKLVEDAKNWYGGYRVVNDIHASLYNIQSVNQFLRRKTINLLEPTFYNNSFEHHLRAEEIKPILASLVNKTSTELDSLSFTVDDYCTLGGMLGRKVKLTEASIKVFLRLLVSEGYLTVDKVPTTSGRLSLKVPNEQVFATLKVMMREWSPGSTQKRRV